MMIVTNAFLLGGILGGALSAWLIPRYGWRSVFYAGGLLPLAALAAMLRWLPESLQFLTVRRRSDARIAAWLRRDDPGVQSHHQRASASRRPSAATRSAPRSTRRELLARPSRLPPTRP
jgi:MFS family permease